jgi:serine/threonine protein kinase
MNALFQSMDFDSAGGRSTPPLERRSSSDLSLEGRVLDGRYRFDRLLGTGGAGVVYRATDLTDSKPVAIKILHEELRAAVHTMSRFNREGKALAKLSHPHIVQIVGYGIADEIPYIAMEFLQGQTVEKLLEPTEPLDFDLSITIAHQMLLALAFAHKAKVVHRDLKPANIFLERRRDKQCHIKLLDFGLAKFLAPDDHTVGHTLTKTGVVMGTPLYMAPEQAIGGKVDVRVDVYAAGSVIFEMLTGRPPFLVPEHHELIKAHLIAPIPRLTEVGVGRAKDRGLERLVEKAMAKDPADRFEDAEAMLHALEELKYDIGHPATTKRSTGWSRRFFSISKRSVWSAAALLILGILLYIGNSTTWQKGVVESDKKPAVNRPPSRDLLSELDIPQELAPIFSKVSQKQIITPSDMKAVQRYAASNPRDARPSLLLAHGFANQRWRRDAISRYLRAYRIDPGSRGDPRMLPDLLRYASHRRYGDAACDAIREIYGDEALAAVNRALKRAPKESAYAKRLLQLKESFNR